LVSEETTIMARLQTFAEIVGSDELSSPLGETGRSPGRPLREYIELADDAYVYNMPVPSVDRQRMHGIAKLDGNEGLRGIATVGSVPISLDHLRDSDPDKTLVRVGYKINYSQEEIEELKLDNSDPRT
jgi:hypothetical protein